MRGVRRGMSLTSAQRREGGWSASSACDLLVSEISFFLLNVVRYFMEKMQI